MIVATRGSAQHDAFEPIGCGGLFWRELGAFAQGFVFLLEAEDLSFRVALAFGGLKVEGVFLAKFCFDEVRAIAATGREKGKRKEQEKERTSASCQHVLH